MSNGLKLRQLLKRVLFDEASSEIWVLNSEFLQKELSAKHSKDAPRQARKPSRSLQQLIDSYTHLSFFEAKHGFLFFPKALSKYFRSRGNKLFPLVLPQFERLLEQQEILHFQKPKTANDLYNFNHYLAKFTQMKVVDELLENSLDKMSYKSFSLLSKFVRVLKKATNDRLADKRRFIGAANSDMAPKVDCVSGQILDVLRMSFLINKKNDRFNQFILMPAYVSGSTHKRPSTHPAPRRQPAASRPTRDDCRSCCS